MKRLKRFTTDRDSPEFFILICPLFRDLKYFEMIGFHFDQHIFSIHSYSASSRKYIIYIDKKDVKNQKEKIIIEKRGLDLDDLLRILEPYKNTGSHL